MRRGGGNDGKRHASSSSSFVAVATQPDLTLLLIEDEADDHSPGPWASFRLCIAKITR